MVWTIFVFTPTWGDDPNWLRRNPSNQLLGCNYGLCCDSCWIWYCWWKTSCRISSHYFFTGFEDTLSREQWPGCYLGVSGFKHGLHDRICQFHCDISVYGNHPCFFRTWEWTWNPSTKHPGICCIYRGLHYIQSYTGNLMNPSVEWNVTYGFVLSVAHVVQAISSINSKMSDEFSWSSKSRQRFPEVLMRQPSALLWEAGPWDVAFCLGTVTWNDLTDPYTSTKIRKWGLMSCFCLFYCFFSECHFDITFLGGWGESWHFVGFRVGSTSPPRMESWQMKFQGINKWPKMHG